LGFVGVYIGFIFQEVKRRPIYITRSMKGGQPTVQDDPLGASSSEANPSPGEATRVEE